MSDGDLATATRREYVDVRDIHPEYREFECVNCGDAYLEHESHAEDFYSRGYCSSCHTGEDHD